MKLERQVVVSMRKSHMGWIVVITLGVIASCLMFKPGYVAADTCNAAAKDGGHYVKFIFDSYDASSGQLINGASVSEQRDNSPGYTVVSDCPNEWGDIMSVSNPNTGITGIAGSGTNDAQTSQGQIVFGDNCFNSNPYLTESAPSGYTFDHATLTVSYRPGASGPSIPSYTANTESAFSNMFGKGSPVFGPPGNLWQSAIANGAGQFTIDLYYNKIPTQQWTLQGYDRGGGGTVNPGLVQMYHWVNNEPSSNSSATYNWQVQEIWQASAGTGGTWQDDSLNGNGLNKSNQATGPALASGKCTSVPPGNGDSDNCPFVTTTDDTLPAVNGARYCQRIVYSEPTGPNSSNGSTDNNSWGWSGPGSSYGTTPDSSWDSSPECVTVTTGGHPTCTAGCCGTCPGGGGLPPSVPIVTPTCSSTTVTDTGYDTYETPTSTAPDGGHWVPTTSVEGYTQLAVNDVSPGVGGSDGTGQGPPSEVAYDPSNTFSYSPTSPSISVQATYYEDATYETSTGATATEWTTYSGPYSSSTTIPNCYSATCSVQVVPSTLPDGTTLPPNGVLAGEPFTVTGSITSTGALPLPATDANGYHLSLTSVSPLAPNYSSGGSGTFAVPLSQPTAPDGVTSYQVEYSPNYWEDTSMNGMGGYCYATVDVYQQFTLTATPTATFTGDAEDPTGVNFSTTVENNSGSPPVPATITSTFSFAPSGSNSSSDVAGSPITTTYDYGSKTVTGSISIPQLRPGDANVTAGDTYCSAVSVPYTTGYIGPGEELADTKGGGTTTSSPCAVVVNKPYFKVYGNGALAGGTFAGSGTTTDGLLADWNNWNGTDYDYGGGSEFSNLATGSITGFASAQQSTDDVRPPPDLNFANANSSDPVSSSGDPYTPALGGGYGATVTLPDESCANPTAWTGQDLSTLSPGTYSYSVSGPLTLGSLSIPEGVNICLQVNSGAVYIAGNITLDGANDATPSWNVSNVPSFTLDANGGDVYIDPTVSELDGLYVAEPTSSSGTTTGGTIYTCGSGTPGIDSPMPDNLLYNDCNQQLTVYGAFEAAHVNLMRTYGSLRDETPTVAGTKAGPNTDTSVPFIRYYCGDPSSPQLLGIHFYQNSGNGLPTMDQSCSAESTMVYILPAPSGSCDTSGAVQLWYAQLSNGDNFYTINTSEPHSEVIGCVPPGPAANTEPMYRFYDVQDGYHFYTTDCDEGPDAGTYAETCNSPVGDQNAGPDGVAYEGVGFYVYTSSGQGGATTSIPVPGGPPTNLVCSNGTLGPYYGTNADGTSAASSPRPTCAAEVFDYSPEFSLSAPPTTGTVKNTNTPFEIYGLPPVL